MSFVRSLLFQVTFYAWTVVTMLLYFPLLLAPRRAIVAAGRLWCRGVLVLLRATTGLGHRVLGREHIPEGPCLYAFKHQSAWETIAAPLLVADPAVIMKRELAWIPFYGWYLARHGMIAVDRKAGAAAIRHIVAVARERVAWGRSVIVYPEGTRRPPGAPPDYQPGIAALYLALRVPVVPVALDSGRFWGRRKFVKRPGTITVQFLAPIPPGLPRQAFMTLLERRIETATAAL